MLAEAGVAAVHFLDDAAQVLRFDGEFAHPAGVAAAEPRGEDYPRGYCPALFTAQSLRGARRATRQSPHPSTRDCFAALAMTNPVD
jgi:hypothetical protein